MCLIITVIINGEIGVQLLYYYMKKCMAIVFGNYYYKLVIYIQNTEKKTIRIISSL